MGDAHALDFVGGIVRFVASAGALDFHAPGDLLHAAAGFHACPRAVDRPLAAGLSHRILFLDQEPVITAAVLLAASAQADERPVALQPFAMQREAELDLLHRLID